MRRRSTAMRRAAAWLGGPLLFGLGAVACAQAPSTTSAVLTPEGSEALERIVRDVERVRQIDAKRPVDVRVVTPQVLRGEIERAVAESRTPAEIARYQAGLVAVGLWPKDRDLLPELLRILTEEVAGLYVAREHALLVVSEEPRSLDAWLRAAVQDPQERMVLHHELVHLLQHQRYPRLFDDDDLFFDQDDVGIAVQSASEGDAVYFGLRADGESPPPELLEASFDLELTASDGAIRAAPLLLQRLLAFPYTQGYRLAYREGAQLLESPPASSEQALHPDRRSADFAVFDLAGVARQLPAGCEPVFQNTVGELQLGILLESFGAPDAAASAEGWDGDRYLAARCASGPALLWVTRWDTESDAADFEAAYARLAPALAARAGLAGPLSVRRHGRDVVVASEALGAWVGAGLPALRESRVRGVEELLDFAQDRTPLVAPQTR